MAKQALVAPPAADDDASMGIEPEELARRQQQAALDKVGHVALHIYI